MRRGLFISAGWVVCAVLAACTTLPEPKHETWKMPKDVFVGVPAGRPYQKIAPLRTKVQFSTLMSEKFQDDDEKLCKNYYRKAANVLLKMAQDRGADAVIDLKSVVYMMDGKSATYAKPECSDDGSEGQILAQGMAVKWIRPAPAPRK